MKPTPAARRTGWLLAALGATATAGCAAPIQSAPGVTAAPAPTRETTRIVVDDHACGQDAGGAPTPVAGHWTRDDDGWVWRSEPFGDGRFVEVRLPPEDGAGEDPEPTAPVVIGLPEVRAERPPPAPRPGPLRLRSP